LHADRRLRAVKASGSSCEATSFRNRQKGAQQGNFNILFQVICLF
jgi:hypothetical protein